MGQAPPSTSPTTCGRCSTSARTTASGPGVYLVGGGTHPGSGLPVIYEGARISARLVLEDLGMGEAADAMRLDRFPMPAAMDAAA